MSGDRTPSDSERDSHDFRDVVVVGGGVAGLSTAVFTARQGLDTLVIDDGGSLLRRNAHLENFRASRWAWTPGACSTSSPSRLRPRAPTGSTAVRREWRRSVRARASKPEATKRSTTPGSSLRSTVTTRTTPATPATRPEPGTSSPRRKTRSVTSRAWGVGILDRGKSYVDTDERGRTGVDGLYAAGRLAEKPHQAAVCAGHGAEVGVTILEEDERGFYHDWVAPEGYFTDRGRQVPPGCEEIDAAERREREEASREAIRERFAAPHPDPQETHPSLEE